MTAFAALPARDRRVHAAGGLAGGVRENTEACSLALLPRHNTSIAAVCKLIQLFLRIAGNRGHQ